MIMWNKVTGYLLWVVVLLYLFILFFPVLIIKSTYEVIPKIIKQGDEFVIVANYCKLLPLPAKYQLTYVGEIRHSTPEVYASNVKVGCDITNFHFSIPESLPTGMYHIELNVMYPPIVKTQTIETDRFAVIEGEDKLETIINLLKGWEAE